MDKTEPRKQPTIVIIGCGAIAETFYLPALGRCASTFGRLVLVDRNLQRAKELAARFGTPDYLTDYHEVLGAIDGAIVAVPHHLHYSISMDLLAGGAHVLCEKPLAETAAEAKEMIRSAGEHGVTLSVNYTRRLFPSYAKVKELLSAGELGDLLSITYFDGDEFKWPTTSGFYFDWRVSKKGILLDIGAHVLDIICWWLGGKPKLLSAKHDSFGGCEAVASVTLEHNGCKGEIRLSRLAKLPNQYTIRGSRGSIEGDVYDWKKFVLRTQANGKKEIKVKLKEDYYSYVGHTVVANFTDVLNKRSEPLVSASEILGSVELLEEAYSRAVRFSMPWYDIVQSINKT